MGVLACPSAGQCTTVDSYGDEGTFDPTAPNAATGATIDPLSYPHQPTSVACPSTGQCITVDDAGHEVTFDPTTPASRTSSTIAGASSLTAIACGSQAQCVTVDAVGSRFIGTAVQARRHRAYGGSSE